MGKRQNNLAELLHENGVIVPHPIIKSKEQFTNSKFNKIIQKVYKSLDGILDEYPIGFGGIDIVTENYFIELDEENHFNQQRKITLRSSFYNNYKFFSVSAYKTFCVNYEHKARTDGKFLETKTSKEQFEGEYTRWKQRAFYDFLKDIYSTIIEKPLYRFSIYQKINDVSIDTILSKKINEDQLVKYISEIFNRVQMDELINAYKQTLFKVNGFAQPITIGTVSAEADKLLIKNKVASWVYITAYNPQSKPLSATENENRNKELKEKIKHFTFKEGIGVGTDQKWEGEKSFLVIGMKKAEGINLAKEFGQIALVFGELGKPAELLISSEY